MPELSSSAQQAHTQLRRVPASAYTYRILAMHDMQLSQMGQIWDGGTQHPRIHMGRDCLLHCNSVLSAILKHHSHA